MNVEFIWHEPDKWLPWTQVEACIGNQSVARAEVCEISCTDKVEVCDAGTGEGIVQSFGLFVHDSYRRKGIATTMYEQIFREMTRRGFKELWSSSSLTPDGHAFWESLWRKHRKFIRKRRIGRAVKEHPLGRGHFEVNLKALAAVQEFLASSEVTR